MLVEQENYVGMISAKLEAKAALDATGAVPEEVNYAVKGWSGRRWPRAGRNGSWSPHDAPHPYGSVA
jgi:hypothetical protein